MPLLDANAYDQIRAALDTSLDSGQLSDETIDLPCFSGRAEAEILARDSAAATYETTDAAKWARVQRAMIYLCAAEIAPSLPGLVTVRVGDFQYTRSAWDGAARAAYLRGLATAELDAYLETDGRVPPIRGLWLACGGRGR